MTAYWPYAAAVVCLLSVVRCAARQHCGLRSLLGGAVCGLGVLALLGLLEPVTGITNSDGVWVSTAVPAGAYRIGVAASDGKIVEASTDIRSFEESFLQVTLP